MVYALAAVLPLETAGRLFVALTITLLVGGTVVLHRTLHGRASCWPLLSLLVVPGWPLLMGFMSYVTGIGLLLLATALWLRLAHRPWPLRLVAGAACALVLFFCHLVVLVLFAAVVGGYELQATGGRLQAARNALPAGLAFVPAGGLFLAGSPDRHPRGGRTALTILRRSWRRFRRRSRAAREMGAMAWTPPRGMGSVWRPTPARVRARLFALLVHGISMARVAAPLHLETVAVLEVAFVPQTFAEAGLQPITVRERWADEARLLQRAALWWSPAMPDLPSAWRASRPIRRTGRRRPELPAGAGMGRAAQAMYWPPLAVRVEPVMKPASSLARNTTQRAISSGSPSRPTGICGRISLVQHLLGHRAHHLGADIARADGVDGDAERGALLRQRLGEADRRRLGGRVVGLAELALLAVDRADVDDPAELALAHALDDRPGHVEQAVDVGRDHLAATAPGSSGATWRRG